MQVNLLEESSEGGIFRILPSYKVKSVGDEVYRSHINTTIMV